MPIEKFQIIECEHFAFRISFLSNFAQPYYDFYELDVIRKQKKLLKKFPIHWGLKPLRKLKTHLYMRKFIQLGPNKYPEKSLILALQMDL